MEQEKLSVIVQLKEDSEEIELRDAKKFTPEELAQFNQTFGESWLAQHPITLNDSELTLNLSDYDLDPEDLSYFAEIYSNPLSVQSVIESKISTFSDLQKFTRVAKAFNLTCLNPMLSSGRDKLFAEKKVLILVNLNGTLVCKSCKPVDTARPCDLKMKNSCFYLRPNYNVFLRKVLEHPRSLVAICSSMIQKNIIPVRSILLHDPEVKKVQDRFMEKVFDRTYTIMNPTLDDEHNTLRDLAKVWNAPELKAKFGPENTLLLESDAAKGERHKGNMFVLFPYEELSVKLNMPNNSYYMEKVADYIVELLNNADSVPQYLMMNGFKIDNVPYMCEDEEFKKILEERKAKMEKKEQKAESPKPVIEHKEEKVEQMEAKIDPELEENIKKLEGVEI